MHPRPSFLELTDVQNYARLSEVLPFRIEDSFALVNHPFRREV